MSENRGHGSEATESRTDEEMEAEIDQLVESYKHSGPLTMTQLRYWQHDNAWGKNWLSA
jgi:uncharacterized protein YcaQ